MSARAVTLPASINADSGPGTLREALSEVCPDGVIAFDSSLNGSTILLTSGLLEFPGHTSNLGPGPNHLAIVGKGTGRVFYQAPVPGEAWWGQSVHRCR